VLDNPWIRDARHLPDIFSHGVWSFLGEKGESSYYRPLMHVIYMISYGLFDLRAWGFHLVSILLHAANTVMVFLLASGLEGMRTRRVPQMAPFTAALLFAVHPVHTEAVAWVAAVPELSFTFFFLLALWFHARAAGPFMPSHLLSVATFLLAMLCKETALAFLLVLPAWDVARGRAAEGWTLKDRLKIYAPFLLVAGLYFVARYHALSGPLVDAGDSHGLSASQLTLNAFPLLGACVATLLLPVGLNFWHSFDPVTSLLSARSLGSIAVAAGLSFSLWQAFRKSRPIFFALMLGVVPLLPALYIRGIPDKPFAERYLYLPSAGFIMAAVWLLLPLLRDRRSIAWCVLVPLAAIGAVATARRNTIWRDDVTLYSDTVRKSPDAVMPRYLLATALHDEGRIDEAIAQYRILVGSHPQDAKFQAALGDALIQQGRLDEAIEHLNAALAEDPGVREITNDLGTALDRKGRPADAIEAYEKALAIDPGYAEAHYNLGAVLAASGRAAEAIGHLAQAVKLKPASAAYRNVLGIEYAKRGLLDEAIEQFEAAVRLAPDEPGYRNNLDRARQGRPGSEEISP
jgi:tetratricopeptide (TPR) repeat protein